MKLLWCWHCKMEIPMLDEQEFAEVASLFRDGVQSVKSYREEIGEPLKRVPMAQRFEKMLLRYEAITGFKETNPNAVWHHRISLYGLPCEQCGKPLRTPEAKLCGSCMAPVNSLG